MSHEHRHGNCEGEFPESETVTIYIDGEPTKVSKMPSICEGCAFNFSCEIERTLASIKSKSH